MRAIVRFHSWAAVLLLSTLSAAGAQPKNARILLVTGNDYPGHPWRLTTPALVNLLRQDTRLDVRVIEDPELLESPALQRYDAVILNYMNWESPSPAPKALQNLRSFVESGKGLMLVHFSCGAFQDWSEFRKLAGRVYDPKLRGHDPRGVFRVEVVEPTHPIMRGIEPFDTDDELYTCLAGDAKITVLASARSKVDQKDYPMAFILSYGKGRVFHTVLGHDVKAITNSSVPELFRRACAWTAKLEPIEGRQP